MADCALGLGRTTLTGSAAMAVGGATCWDATWAALWPAGDIKEVSVSLDNAKSNFCRPRLTPPYRLCMAGPEPFFNSPSLSWSFEPQYLSFQSWGISRQSDSFAAAARLYQDSSSS